MIEWHGEMRLAQTDMASDHEEQLLLYFLSHWRLHTLPFFFSHVISHSNVVLSGLGAIGQRSGVRVGHAHETLDRERRYRASAQSHEIGGSASDEIYFSLSLTSGLCFDSRFRYTFAHAENGARTTNDCNATESKQTR